MKKQIYIALFLISFSAIWIGCNKEDDPVFPEEEYGSITGKITDYATGEAVKNANVQLRPTGETTLTGSDGMYNFLELPAGQYSITVSKAEYTDLVDDYIIDVKKGTTMRRDLQIKKIPTYLRITDMAGNDISQLDFGSDGSITVKSFNIYNNGVVSVNCSIHYSCSWIKSVSTVPGTLQPGQNVMVSVEINRALLNAGENSTNLYVISNNGNNGLEIKAYGSTLTTPSVNTKSVTSDGTAYNKFKAEVTNAGIPAYHKRGFCLSRTNITPTINDIVVEVAGTGTGEYQYSYTEIYSSANDDWNTWYDEYYTPTYYLRAWVMYGINNEIQYGNVVPFRFYN